MMLGITTRNFKYLTIPTFILLCKSVARSDLDYCSSFGAPYRKEYRSREKGAEKCN